MSENFIVLLSDVQVDSLRDLLEKKGFESRKIPYAKYSYAGPGITVTVYEKNNKLLLQGKGTREFVEFSLEPCILKAVHMHGDDAIAGFKEPFTPHFGIDESGKGDYFGPLVVAGVYADGEIAAKLERSGVCDSKLVTKPDRIRKLASAIRSIPGIACEVVRIGPERYNELYARFGNLNQFLAWGHIKVIELLMQKVPQCRHALSDQFANERVLNRALSARKLDIRLDQRVRAEQDVVVAAASILAREGFIDWMDEASRKSGINLPLGASRRVITAAGEVINRYGAEMLPKVVKMHFKTTAQVLSRLPGGGRNDAVIPPEE